MIVEVQPSRATTRRAANRRPSWLVLGAAGFCAAACLRLESSIGSNADAENCSQNEPCGPPRDMAPVSTLTHQPRSGQNSPGAIVQADELPPVEPSPLCPNPVPSSCSLAPVELLAQRCAGASCHGTQNSPPLAQVDLLSTPEQLFARLSQSYGTGSCAEYLVVDDRQPGKSLLLNKIGAATPVCGLPMPIGSVLLAEELDCIADWLQAAATCP